MHIPLVAGREFDERDRLGAPPVAIVNEAWVKVNLEGRNPVGQRVTSFGLRMKPQEMEIVGLARNARYDDLTGDFPAVVYLPFEQNLDVPVDEMTFFLRVAGNPQGYASAVREIVHQADARIPVAGLSTQAAQIEREMVPETLFARLCTAFADAGAGDCVGGIVRDHVVRGGAAHGRDRNPHGAGSAARNGSLDGAARRADPCGGGARHQSAGGAGRVETCRVSSFRGQTG